LKAFAVKVAKSVYAGFTSTEAVKAEKNLAVLVGTRVLLAAGASTALVETIVKLFN
jgi:hypothetical protein